MSSTVDIRNVHYLTLEVETYILSRNVGN